LAAFAFAARARSTAASDEKFQTLINYLRENGIVVITDSEATRVLKTLDGAYKSQYGLGLIDSVADWYGVASDEEVRATFRRAVDSGEIYNFIPDWPREKQARLDLALQGFAEDSGLAVRLRDFVKRNWDLIAQVSGVAAKLAFDEWCRRNPSKSPEEAQLRQLVGKALDAYNVGVVALGEFRTALGFVRALKAAASGAGATALSAVVAAGVSLFTTAVFWYAQWWVEARARRRSGDQRGGIEERDRKAPVGELDAHVEHEQGRVRRTVQAGTRLEARHRGSVEADRRQPRGAREPLPGGVERRQSCH
jgi:hypothetical protein